jgi:hypothetical protein
MSKARARRGHILAFLALPIIDLPGFAPSGIQAAGLADTSRYLYVVPVACLVAAIVAGELVFFRHASTLPTLLATVIPGLVGLAPCIYLLVRVIEQNPSAQAFGPGSATLPAVSVLGFGFWLSLVGLLGVVIGGITAAAEG